MSLTLGDNFSYQASKPLDARLKYDTVAAMKAVADATMYDGCLAYCVADGKTYQWKSTNTVDSTTGRWREFSSGGGGGGTVKTATLSAGSTSVTFTDVPTSGDNLISVFTSVVGLDYDSMSQSGSTITVTYPSQSSSITVYLKIESI